MADPNHVALLRQGLHVWNSYRYEHTSFRPNLSSADFHGLSLREYDLREADLRGSQLVGCDLCKSTLTQANLTSANLSGAFLHHAHITGAKASDAQLESAHIRFADMAGVILDSANLDKADLVNSRITQASFRGATLRGSDLRGCKLDKTDLSDAHLEDADLSSASLVQTRLSGAFLDRARIYGISAWDVELTGASQMEMIITDRGTPLISTDNLEIAQFLYLLLNNSKLRDVIDTITSKVVLILGRFSPEQKPLLDAIRSELRKLDYVPILFDFDKPTSKDLTGTIETLARMARFILADLTDPSSVPHELATITRFLTTTPLLPLRRAGSSGYQMFSDLSAYPWVLPIHEYLHADSLIATLPQVIAPAKEMSDRFRRPAAQV